ncbi:MAG: hypothetical protein JXR70_16995 [Spirochaetales bacterium]|nr:hypothetical protein [Spirochaetales bacterium]
MKLLYEFKLDDGTSIIIEADKEDKGHEVKRGSGEEKKIQRASKTFNQQIKKITPLAEAISQELSSHKNSPSEVTVEFGIKLGGETDLIIASAAVEANFKVIMKWNNDRK